jgi:hypothetical protein
MKLLLIATILFSLSVYSKIFIFSIRQDKKYKKALFLVFGFYYYVSKIFRKNRTIPNPVSGQISDDVYPLM